MLRQFVSAPSKAARMAARVPRTAAATSPFLQTATPFRSATATAAVRPRQPLSVAAGRWYSSESDASKADASKADASKADASKADASTADASEAAKDGEAVGEPLSAADATALRKDLESKTKEALEWKDKFLRSVADFRNLQERTQREIRAARDFAITGFAKDLVDSVDNLDRALSMVAESAVKTEAGAEAGAEAANQDFVNLVDGLKMTETVLLQTLKKHGLERFNPNGDKFNPNEHEATFMTPMPDKEHNTVFHTQQKGFRLHGRVLRAAKVGVVNNK
ncbi:molecular chaperone GrpE [Sporothrix schenckii 1099-18]|uniref:GrpE protein homolog n=2 Tax=Sporothrix schenckii TaxID=29908 RepID=U7PNS7_SPOS1|nr:molecular chaperone GrpE [Sporothrix schenckii 1099-18]ERS96374.1 hypothetical protein HMPREF1624_07284 [Sporothrix schenckii ATCC 58251]KJR87100.1 molecular chaperone GrpE [Sporothrix schenckii 1099-18]